MTAIGSHASPGRGCHGGYRVWPRTCVKPAGMPAGRSRARPGAPALGVGKASRYLHLMVIELVGHCRYLLGLGLDVRLGHNGSYRLASRHPRRGQRGEPNRGCAAPPIAHLLDPGGPFVGVRGGVVRRSCRPSPGGNVKWESLDDVLETELKDLYSAEKQLVKALPDIVEAASSSTSRSGGGAPRGDPRPRKAVGRGVQGDRCHAGR